MNSGQDLSWRVLVADASGDHGELPADQHGREVLPDHVDLTVPKLSPSGPHSSYLNALLVVSRPRQLLDSEELLRKMAILAIERTALENR